MQKDTIIHTIHSVTLDATRTNIAETIPDINDVVVNGKSLGLGGYLDIGLIDTMRFFAATSILTTITPTR